MRKHGPWTIHSTKNVYSDPWLAVYRDEVTRPDGAPGSYATVQIKSGVCVLALDDRVRLHLTKEFHYAVGKVTIEGVSGGIEEGESPEQAAERELAEELGLRAAKWSHLGTVDPFTAAVFSRVDLFLAQELSTCDKNPEGTELIEAVELELGEAVEMVRASEITHSPTCTAILHLALLRSESRLAK
ncbi:MAG: NUDIX hydrolase [Planctomycetota bacterium]|nr:NUDIX hydrolase [Planctomycetota bacterium]